MHASNGQRETIVKSAGQCRGWMNRLQGLLLVTLLLMLITVQADDGGLSLELNKLEDTDDACRAYLVLDNGTAGPVESLRLQLVLFDPEGVITRRLAVQAGPVGAGKTSVRIFDVSGQQCGDIGRILLNDISECEGPDGEIADCADLLEVSSRADVPFDD